MGIVSRKITPFSTFYFFSCPGGVFLFHSHSWFQLDWALVWSCISHRLSMARVYCMYVVSWSPHLFSALPILFDRVTDCYRTRVGKADTKIRSDQPMLLQSASIMIFLEQLIAQPPEAVYCTIFFIATKSRPLHPNIDH